MEIDNKKMRTTHNDDSKFIGIKYKDLSTDELAIIMKRIRKSTKIYQDMFSEICRRMDSLINQFIHSFNWSSFEFNDMYSMGVIALSKAIEKWNPDRFSSFTTAVYFYIRKEIRRSITSSSFIVRPPFTSEAYIGNDKRMMGILDGINNPISYSILEDNSFQTSSNDMNINLTDMVYKEMNEVMVSLGINNLVRDFINHLSLFPKSNVLLFFPMHINELKLIENSIYEGSFFKIGGIF